MAMYSPYFSCPEDPTEREAWRATVRGVHRVRHGWSNQYVHACVYAMCLFIFYLSVEFQVKIWLFWLKKKMSPIYWFKIHGPLRLKWDSIQGNMKTHLQSKWTKTLMTHKRDTKVRMNAGVPQPRLYGKMQSDLPGFGDSFFKTCSGIPSFLLFLPFDSPLPLIRRRVTNHPNLTTNATNSHLFCSRPELWARLSGASSILFLLLLAGAAQRLEWFGD